MQIQVVIPGYVDMREPQYDLLEIWSKYLMRKALKDNNGFCPCAIEKNEDTKCMCKEFREMASGTCHCGLYTKTE